MQIDLPSDDVTKFLPNKTSYALLFPPSMLNNQPTVIITTVTQLADLYNGWDSSLYVTGIF
jgi:hypothetical protein